MMPPYCHVCGLDLQAVPEDDDLSAHFTLVYFGLTRQEQKAEKAMGRGGWAGHPSNAFWFCNEHAGLAESRTAMHWRDAIAAINAETGRTPPNR